MLIQVNNPTNEGREKTALSENADSGSSSLSVLNIDGFAINDYIVIRRIGDEQAELHKIASISAGTFNITSTTSHSHHEGAEIFVIPYNQLEVSRKVSKSSDYTVLATVDIEPDQIQTVYDDTGGQTSYFYRVRFFNSTTGQYSAYSSTIKGSGSASSQAGRMVDQVLRRTNDKEADFTLRSEVMRELNLGYQHVYNALMQSSSEYYQKRLEIQTEDFKHEYTLPDDFKEIERIKDGDGVIIPPIPVADRYNSRGYELVGKNTLYLEDVPEPNNTSTITVTKVFENDDYNEDGTWTASDDAENVTTDNDEFKTGIGSINFDVDVSNSANNQATISNSTFTAQDLSSYEDTGKFRVWMYLPDVTYLSTIEMRWGSDSSTYWSLDVEKDYKNHAFHDGWNLIEYDWGDSSVTETGSPVTADAAAIDYISFIIKYTASQPDDEDFRLDGIRIANVWEANYVYEVTYLKQPAEITYEMDLFEIPEGYEFLLTDYAVAQILFRRGDDTRARETLRMFEKSLSRTVTQAAKRTRRMIGFSRNARNYRFRGSDSSRIIHGDGAVTIL